nr:MAG TPA: hypothetical protein [Caudoviricetes sp.]
MRDKRRGYRQNWTYPLKYLCVIIFIDMRI